MERVLNGIGWEIHQIERAGRHKNPRLEPFDEDLPAPEIVAGIETKLLIVTDNNAYRRNARGAWATLPISGSGSVGPVSELIGVHYRGDLVSYTISDQIGRSRDEGKNFTFEDAPNDPTGNVFMHDRSPSGRYWTLENDAQKVYSSDDRTTTWDEASPFIDFATAWHLSAHPTDSSRVVITYEDGISSDLIAYVSTDRGDSWTANTIGTYLEGSVVWLPNGRLVALVIDLAGDELYRLYSDDDGATWSAAELLVTNTPSSDRLELDDVRVTDEGYIFALVNRQSGNMSRYTLRSADGAAFDVLDPHTSTRAPALAYNEITEQLFIAYQTDTIYVIPNAKRRSSANWVSGGTALSNVPTDAVPVGASRSNMVVLYGEGYEGAGS